jgi:two-component system sensor histidine kinase KdpD
VIRGEREEARPPRPPERQAPFAWGEYLRTAVVLAVCSLLGWLGFTRHLSETNIVMVFLLGVTYVAARYGRGPAIASAVASVLVFDFFFVPPYLSFEVSDVQYILTFAVMFIIGFVISTLTARIRDQLHSAQQIERRTAALFRLTKQLSEVAGPEFLIGMAGLQLREIFNGEVVLFVRDAAGHLELRFGQDTTIAQHEVNAVVARWVADHDHAAGAGTDTLPNATALFVPLIGSQRTVGAVGVKPNDPERFLDPDQRRLLETCASLIALSLERDHSVLEAQEARLRVQTERLRNSLLSSVSHGLRTPLAAIAGATSSLLETAPDHQPDARRELLYTILDESRRLGRLVDNLLDMTRLTSGTIALNKQWHVLEEIVGSALGRLRRDLEHHAVRVDIPDDLPLLSVDGVLMEQVFFNLLENANRYTPAGSQIEITARVTDKRVEIRVADNGPGLPPGTESRVFEKFFRGATVTDDGRRGVGLGLAICHAIIEAHSGRISAQNGPNGGAEFILSLPCEETAPRIDLDEVPARSGS